MDFAFHRFTMRHLMQALSPWMKSRQWCWASASAVSFLSQHWSKASFRLKAKSFGYPTNWPNPTRRFWFTTATFLPERIVERVFVRDFGVEDGFELWPF